MPLKARVWGLGTVLLLAGALAATFLLFALVAMRVALRASEVQVPNLVGTTVAAASQMATDVGLALRVDSNQRADERVPAGSITQQEPAPDTQARRQRTIRVWVSSGPRTTVVPGLVGQTERTARLRLDEDGLEMAMISEFRSPDYPADAVVAQDPAPTSRAPRVSVLLNRGEQATTYVMPDLIGTSGERAAEALRTRGFRVSIVGSQPYQGVPPGTVVRQQPAGGFRVDPADAISIEVSR
ncbi:MAG: PASTA domain-containing protein [Acidobacteria bacterium]|nr:PASTA domain-containing protein [Acidobacteriota bacterium]